MYLIKTNKEGCFLEINNPTKTVNAKIYLNHGASLQELTLKGQHIIQDLNPIPYSDSYASSILFPFANRIKDGAYSFDGKNYQLVANQQQENNALHGLVYNKIFKVVNQKTTETEASVTLEYVETEKHVGFPFTYTIHLEYIVSNDSLILNVSVTNTDSKPFPYTLGWHPYFISDNLKASSLVFESSKKLIIGERNITTGVKDIEPVDKFDIEDKQLDDCWILEGNTIEFLTPKYHLTVGATGNNNFLQVYTPKKQNAIAIEPTTGVSDSFNNKIGLETLKPNQTKSISWSLKLTN